eukprot:EC726839.1.p1 GENE.EC726839.1~~EC726839.1.p1  ORF type:complete len:242 (+),score=46.33 EC726839.1:90-815(+)
MSSEIARALAEVNRRILQAASAAVASHMPRLVAVSKLKPASDIQDAYNAGQRHFGENYVQELVSKASELPADIKWHFIGPLQSNKAKALVAVPNLFMVESVHSAKIASSLDKACAAIQRAELGVFVQVNTSGEDTKSGVEPQQCLALVQHVIGSCPRLRFKGLMTIGSPQTPEADFKVLVECRQTVSAALQLPVDAIELSMGMSDDFERAIAAGSTNVRVGSLIFGHRPAKAAASAADSVA